MRQWLASSEASFTNRALLMKLAVALQVNHHDRWLADFLTEPPSPDADPLLSSAIHANYSGNPQQGQRDALAAKQKYWTAGNKAGVARSEFEVIYALHRLSKSKECLQELSNPAVLPRNSSYRWLQIQLLLERSTCAGMAAQFDSASRAAEQAAQKAGENHYGILQLRALGFQATMHRISGNLPESWKENLTGLTLFWGESYPADREIQFYSDLEAMAEQQEQWNTAALMQREVVHATSESARPDIAAIAHFRMAQAAESAGNMTEFEQEMKTAYQMFSSLPQDRAIQLYQSYCETALATIEARHGNIQSAKARLQQVSSAIPDSSNNILRLRYLNAWALVARAGNDGKEEQYLRDIAAIGNAGFSGLRSEQERWEWKRVVDEASLRLLELTTQQPHDPVKALEDWESYRAIQLHGYAANIFPGDGKSNTPLISRIRGLKDSTLVSFAPLSGSVLAWVADDHGVQEYRLAAGSEELRRNVNEFARLCANPASPVAEVRKMGAALYRQLFLPLHLQLSPERRLLVETSSWLGNIPLPALVMEGGRYLDDATALINTPGVFYGDSEPDTGPEGFMLLASPGAVERNGEHYPALQQAEEEVTAVSELYPRALCLRGKSVTIEKLLQQLPQASIFHFAGHAISRGDGGELLVHQNERDQNKKDGQNEKDGQDEKRGYRQNEKQDGGQSNDGHNKERDGGAQISAATLRSTSMKQLRLAVLSACSTAGAEGNAALDPNGLVRAFMSAGTRAVIASRWDVDSSATAALMRTLYQQLSQGETPARALRAARLSTRSSPETSHPYYWSAFEVFSTQD